MAVPFRFDRSWSFPLPPDALWAVFERTDAYLDWWSWLREFESDGLRPGTTARCTIQSPLPYALRCTIRIDAVTAPELVVATVDGDLRGPARLEIVGDGDGSVARLVWALGLGNPVLAGLARAGRPMMAWAHDVVVAAGVEQFRRRALDGESGAGRAPRPSAPGAHER